MMKERRDSEGEDPGSEKGLAGWSEGWLGPEACGFRWQPGHSSCVSWRTMRVLGPCSQSCDHLGAGAEPQLGAPRGICRSIQSGQEEQQEV